ncbi:hypothetical protein UlMin_044055 [Ulmus minor]
MAEAKPAKRKPVFDQLQLGTNGHTLTMKVVSLEMVFAQVRKMRIVECLVEDENGTIVFTSRNQQVDLIKPGTTIILCNVKIEIFKGSSMTLAMDKWGQVEVTKIASFTVKEDTNLSLVKYELVNVVLEKT